MSMFYVEHLIIMIMRPLLFFFILLYISGCKSENAQPELLDPIYLDLVKEQRSAEDELKKSLDKISTLEKEYGQQEARSMDKKITQKDLFNEKERNVRLAQNAEYYRIAALKRLAESRISYKKAFMANEAWPDPKENESYLLQKEMRNKSRSWSDRVPKLNNPVNKEK